MLREALCALGLACGGVQPDVSGFTIMNLLAETRGAQASAVPALGALYEQVIVSHPQNTRYVADLWRDGQPYAALACFDGDFAQRCVFSYWDDGARVEGFLGQAAQWVETEVGTLERSHDPDGLGQWSAADATRQVTLKRPAEGAEAQADVVFAWRN